MKLFKTLSLSLMFSLAVFVTAGFGQSETVTTSGTVLSPLAVTGTNLAFSTEILPGVDEEIARIDPAAARFDITGEVSEQITADFTLPTELEHATDGTATLAIAFVDGDAGHAEASTSQGSATGFDPNSTLTVSLSTAGELFIWLGGTVKPINSQLAGDYSATITLDTAYTGI